MTEAQKFLEIGHVTLTIPTRGSLSLQRLTFVITL